MRELKGKSASPGLASGVAVLYQAHQGNSAPSYSISQSDISGEHRRLRTAIDKSIRELNRIRHAVHRDIGRAEAMIFDTHIALLEDKDFLNKVRERVRRELVNVENALLTEINVMSGLLSSLDNEYLRERASDINDIGRRVLRHLRAGQEKHLRTFPSDSVIVTEELFPSDTINLDRENVVAIVTERGGENSHAAILARSFGIPFVTAVPQATQQIADGMPLLVDGQAGIITIFPTKRQRSVFKENRYQYGQETSEAEAVEVEPSVTVDGCEISLYANIGRVHESRDVLLHNLKGVALFRTEFLFLEVNTPPSAETQQDVYGEIAQAIKGLPLTIRTLDLGGDIQPWFLANGKEANPAMGMRGLRFSLMEKDLFGEQIRGILQIAMQHDISILLPMVIDANDFIQARDFIGRIAESLGISHLPPIGAMIETPSAVFQAPEIAEESDFLSIGTNDLSQFILAADRQSAAMMDNSFAMHPSMLRAVRMIMEAASLHDCPVYVCGEAAGDPMSACLLVGLGARTLSMSPIRSARVRQAIRRCQSHELKEAAEQACRFKNPNDVRQMLIELLPHDRTAQFRD